MRKRKKTSLEAAFDYIQFEKEIQNYTVYLLLRKIILKKYKINQKHLESAKDYKTVEARMIFYSLLKKYTTYNYRNISLLFNIRNHSKVHHAIKLVLHYIMKNLCKETILKDYYEVENYLLDNIKSNI